MNINKVSKMSAVCILILILFSHSAYSKAPVPLNGFPVILDTAFVFVRGSSPIISDFNGDGNNEILSVYSGGSFSRVIVFKSNGEYLQGWPVIINGARPVTAAGDIDGDGDIDIIIRTMDSIYAFDYSGSLLNGFPVNFLAGNTDIILYDITGDSELELISYSGNDIRAFDSDGNLLTGWPFIIPENVPGSVIASNLSAADLNKDNIPEIIVPYSDFSESGNGIYILTAEGNVYKNSPIVSDSGYHYATISASLYSKNETGFFVINSCSDLNNKSKTRTSVYNSQINLTKRYYSESLFNTSGTVSIGKFKEGNEDFHFCFGYQGYFSYLISDQGKLQNGWPVETNSFYYKTADMLTLNSTSMIITTENYADTSGGYSDSYGYIRFLNFNGSEAVWSPLRLLGLPLTSPTFCDLNSDGMLDFAVMSEKIYFSGVNVRRDVILNVFTFPGVVYNPKDLHWPMYAHDRYRTNQYGFVPPDEPVGIQPISGSVPGSFSLSQNYPNPFNPVTTIKFDIKSSSFVSLIIFDALGRQIETPVQERLKPGSYSILFNGSGLSSGVYFYSLKADGFTESRKMLLLK